jgi:hypothetical protein
VHKLSLAVWAILLPLCWLTALRLRLVDSRGSRRQQLPLQQHIRWQ